MQLRHKFFIAISLLTTLPLLLLQFSVVERMEKEVYHGTEHELNASLEKMAGELKLIIHNQKSIAKGLARVPAVSQFANNISPKQDPNVYTLLATNLETFFLNYQHSVPSIQALRFIEPSGKTLVKVKEGKPIDATNYDSLNDRFYISDQSPKQYFKEAIDSARQGEVAISDFELGQVTFGADFCPSMVRYSVPVWDDADKLQGILVVNMWGTRIDSSVDSAMHVYPVNSYIIEVSKNKFRDGIYLYHRDTQKRFANQLKSDFRFSNEVSEEEWKKMQMVKTFGSSIHEDGRMFFYKTISPFQNRETKWLLLIETSSEKIFESVNNMRRSIWLLVASLVLISLLLAVWASGKLTQPVHNLAGIIRKFADGERGVRYEGKVNDEVGLAGRAFNYLTSTLERTEKEKEQAVRAVCQSERLAALGQLAAGIGHEINNPLLNIMSLATLVEESLGNGHDDAKNDLLMLRKEGQRCARIIQGILNFARENEPSYMPFDLSKLIKETLELLSHRIDSAEINIMPDVNDGLIMEGDAGMIQQVLVNILLNAIQASSANDLIEVKANRQDEKLVIEIIDQGEGIKGNDFSKIFDPFFTTKSEGEGTGLGLSISYGIVKHHGGSIAIENMEDTGVKVTIILPEKYEVENNELDYLEAKYVG